MKKYKSPSVIVYGKTDNGVVPAAAAAALLAGYAVGKAVTSVVEVGLARTIKKLTPQAI